MRVVTTLLLASVFAGAIAQAEVGIPAKGGYPEYLFIETVPSEEAHATAEMIAQAIFTGRMVPSRRWPSTRSTVTWNPSA